MFYEKPDMIQFIIVIVQSCLAAAYLTMWVQMLFYSGGWSFHNYTILHSSSNESRLFYCNYTIHPRIKTHTRTQPFQD